MSDRFKDLTLDQVTMGGETIATPEPPVEETN